YDTSQTKSAFTGTANATMAYCNSGGRRTATLLSDNIDEDSLKE
ncbi:hypothetical protein LCGC14_2219170, partial [marine sediment metagenome]